MAIGHSSDMAEVIAPDQVLGYPLKRALDVSVSGVALMLLSPLFLLIAAAIKVTSPGPVFYRQMRLGWCEQPFAIFKFRSMRMDADRVGPKFTSANDPRITQVGRLLRSLSLDELPQLINVLRGEMSLFGPRPYAGFELAGFSAEERCKRALVRPGISGLAQSSGRSSLDPHQTMKLDLEYVEQCSLHFDLMLFLRTVCSLLRISNVN